MKFVEMFEIHVKLNAYFVGCSSQVPLPLKKESCGWVMRFGFLVKEEFQIC